MKRARDDRRAERLRAARVHVGTAAPFVVGIREREPELVGQHVRRSIDLDVERAP
jgi:hypothetical protein